MTFVQPRRASCDTFRQARSVPSQEAEDGLGPTLFRSRARDFDRHWCQRSGRPVIEQQPLTLDESLRKEIVSKAEFTSAFKTAEDVFALIERVDMREITYLSDGLRIKGFVLAPKKEGRYPVLMWNRGGCRENVGVLTRYGLARWVAPFADWGYVVVGSQYRGAPGSEGKDEFGGADVNDVMNLLPLLEALPNADPSRIGMAGFSRGALMTYLALTKTDRIKAAMVASAPAVEWGRG